ncbi:TetR/AcrR family transcriptional regulator [Demequina sp. SYSU T00039]|uniref:TetR/AcrR family transcriptional regulator n=1 Tax=Demequina lignilytica TaxID=3051663 RepID=A0AAW7LZQ7_9MICO|nr:MULTISPECIES: TetR/AcrR family transcriptional regulator [unclassified Demequina]MDN4486859.1 TetR/AcrR family transcriptional regulator [Demequina sp. SYSU T00039]MDN4489543.1 TetR/AcrR family transcriptional regulator [Demequina sp. SYSU T00068]
MTDTATRRRGDTRARIQDVALERFTSQGYDQTSLREIAEDLGVTKAALYYHFKSKEEILDSLIAQVLDEVDALVTWMNDGPATRERRLEMIARLVDVTRGTPGEVMRCVQQNEVALQNLASTTGLVHQLKQKLWDSSLPADAPLEDRLRMRMAVMTVLIANKLESDLGGTVEERGQAALRVAADLVP